MKVYVIKNKQTKEYQTVVMDFIPDIRQSNIFIDYEVALAYCPSDCEVVEGELIEKTELADHTKKVRKEVIEKLKIESPFWHINGESYYKLYPEILDQIQGEQSE